ncbi:MAG TPA: carbon-nitrogen hydrolase family protein [Bryobacteraceae bacterium]|nr:carbon-nitrogen hydrolase family protein [Bryobacteraceae bacterium]
MLRAAVLQTGSVPWDTAATLAKLRQYARQARAGGAELLVFPEALIGGYPKGMDFGVKVGQRSDEGRAQFRHYAAGALTDFEALSEIARENELWMTGGVIEREGGTLYCTATYHAPDGSLAGKHRKVMPTGAERLIWGFGDGSTLRAVETPWGSMAAAICWENYMPQLRLALYAQGVRLYCAPTVDERETWLPSMRHIAVEGRCFVLSAVQYLEEGEWGAIRGGSVIVDPFGNILAGPLRGEEGLLFADIDPETALGGKFDLDVTGHYARPDLFQLTVNETPQTAVATLVE